jgi:hypothetical protein
MCTPPAHGRVTVKKAKVSATNYKQCVALEVTGYVALYRSQPDFSGNDAFVLEVKFPSGRTETQRFTMTIAAAGSSRRDQRVQGRGSVKTLAVLPLPFAAAVAGGKPGESTPWAYPVNPPNLKLPPDDGTMRRVPASNGLHAYSAA